MTDRDPRPDPAGVHDLPEGVLVVLAGGRSSRFGTDKALALFHESTAFGSSEPLALRALRRLAPLAPRRLLVRAAPFPGLPADVLQVADPAPGCGPAQALDAAFRALPAAPSAVESLPACYFVAPCDLPWLGPQVYVRLARALGAAPVACVRTHRGLEPLVSVWTQRAAGQLAAAVAVEPELALHRFLAGLGAVAVACDDDRLFLNVNTRDDLAAARAAELVPGHGTIA